MNLSEFKQNINGKKVSVIGIGVSNIPLIKMILSFGAIVTAHDKGSAEKLGENYETLKDMGAKFALGEDYLKLIPKDTDYIFKTPGVRFDKPEFLEAASRGVIFSSEMDLFFELCPVSITAVTGSDGKTTTTTLISEFYKKEGYTCHIGGNIGTPLVDKTEEIDEKDKVVLELSSFQLHRIKKSPHIAVVTNVTPNHLDWHTDFNEYIDAKKNIFKYQTSDDIAVFNYDNEITRNFAKEAKNPVYFSRVHDIENGVCINENNIVLKKNGKIEKTILNIDKIKIPGLHNVENYMAAIAATLGEVSDETVQYVAENFGGVPHRIEFVREIDGVKYYNDSIASSPARTTAGLKSFGGKKLILIAGGYDKKIPFDDFGEIVNDYVKDLVLVGATSPKIEEAVKKAENYNNLPIYRENDFKAAVLCAKEIAKSGDIIILSPACASFDLFKNFEERGNAFKNIVNGI